MNKIIDYIKQSVAELKKVSWPTRADVKSSTYIVLATTIIISLFLGFVDKIISAIIETVLK